MEVSCGRGGGLRAFLDPAGCGAFVAIGLDVTTAAIGHCRPLCEGREDVDFVGGNAMDLPFADASVDVLLNVEAANDRPDRALFFAEVRPVLKPDGVFLYADAEKARNAGRMAADLIALGFRSELRAITANVAEACKLDSRRPRTVIRQQPPLFARLLFPRDLQDHAAVEGSSEYRHFVSRERRSHMTSAVPA